MTFRNHEKILRVRMFGKVAGDAFSGWLVAEAEELGLCGWSRPCADGSLDALFAGDEGSVEALLAALGEGSSPAGAPQVVERLRRGDEPIWSGFHSLPPM